LPDRLGELTDPGAEHESWHRVAGPPKTPGQFNARGKLSKEAGKARSGPSAPEKDSPYPRQATGQTAREKGRARAEQATSFQHQNQSDPQIGTTGEIKQVKSASWNKMRTTVKTHTLSFLLAL